MTSESIPAWAFLVARGRLTGYQLLLAPDFIVTSRESALLMDEVRGEVAAQDPPMVTDIVGPISGPLRVVYRTARATRRDIGLADRPEELLLDRAGRPLVLTYGYVCRGSRAGPPDDQDLRVARDAAVATYRRFHAAEEQFPLETSQPYSVHSAVAPAQAAPPQAASRSAAPARLAPSRPAASQSPPPWTSQILPGSPRPAAARRPPAVVIALIAVLALAALASGAYVLNHGRQTKVHGRQVEVPNVVGKDQAVAVQQIRKADLVPKLEAAPSSMPSGIVVRTRPQGGNLVDSHTVIHVEVSEGSSPAITGTP